MLLFLSDLHLSPERPTLLSRFRALLEEQAGRVEALYILGDLFDAWIGDDDPAPFAAEVKGVLKRFGKATPLFFQRGNRDFLVGDRFAAETGARLLEDEALVEHQGLRLLLMHGDQLCTDDIEYQQVRAQLRSPGFRRQALALSIPERRALAAEYRRRSGESLSLKPDDITDVNADAVRRALEIHQADLLIHGHTHRPAIHELETGDRPARRVVLPDWRENDPRVGATLDAGRVEWVATAAREPKP